MLDTIIVQSVTGALLLTFPLIVCTVEKLSRRRFKNSLGGHVESDHAREHSSLKSFSRLLLIHFCREQKGLALLRAECPSRRFHS